MLIDEQLRAAGWVVQDKKALNLFAGPGVAVRETVMAAGHGHSPVRCGVAVSNVRRRAAGRGAQGAHRGWPASFGVRGFRDRDPLHQRMDIDAPWLSEGSGFRVNGLDVTPWVEQELDRRVPGRSERRAERPADPGAFHTKT